MFLVLFAFVLLCNTQQEFAASYSLHRPSQTNGGVEQGTMHYSWSQAKIHQVAVLGDELMVYKAPQTGTIAATCNASAEQCNADSCLAADCLINTQVVTVSTDGVPTIQFSFSGGKCQLSHWVLPIPDCVNPTTIIVKGGQGTDVGASDLCGNYNGIATNRQLKIDGAGPFTVTMPGTTPGTTWLGIKGGTDCGVCSSVGFTCAPSHSGEARYRRGTCGSCQSGSIAENQPRFFLTSTEYQAASGTTVVGGRTCNIHRRAATGDGPVSILYHDGTSVCGALFDDGTRYVFTNVVPGPQTLPAEPSSCRCDSPIDIAVLFDVGNDVNTDELADQRTFGNRFVEQFAFGPKGSQFALFEQQASGGVRTLLSIQEGNTLTNVRTGVNQLACPSPVGGGKGFLTCQSGTSKGNVVQAINTATTNLMNMGRSFAAKAIVVVSNGYSNTQAEVEAAVTAARARGVTFIAVGLERTATNGITLAQLNALAGNTNNVYEWQDFKTLAFDSQDLVGATCDANPAPCGACCGICSCGVCQPVQACQPSPFSSTTGCASSQLSGQCCQTSATGSCVPTSACHTATCVNGTCAQAGGCPPSDGCFTYTCNAATGLCNAVSSSPPSNACTTYRCVGGAWVGTSKNCTGPDTACTDYRCDTVTGNCLQSTKPACVTQPCQTIGCPNRDCFNSVCNADGTCSYTPLNCNDNNPCATDTCVNNQCVNTQRTCTGSDPCLNYFCRNGQCTAEPIMPIPTQCLPPTAAPTVATQAPTPQPTVAGDTPAPTMAPQPTPPPTTPPTCTVDTCKSSDPCFGAICVAGECQRPFLCVPPEEVVCFCDDKNNCTFDVCNPDASCSFSPIECTDGNACTIDTCDPTLGCVHTAVECTDGDLCTTDRCDPVTGGCVFDRIVCVDDNNCTVDACDSAFGCLNTPLICEPPAGSSNCSISSCENITSNCTTRQETCFNMIGLVAGIAGGVVAAIIIAAIVGAGAAVGGGVFAVSQGLQGTQIAHVVNNPLYDGAGNARENPLAQ